MRLAYRWAVVAAAFTLMFVGFGAAYSFAAFFLAFQAEFGAPRAVAGGGLCELRRRHRPGRRPGLRPFRRRAAAMVRTAGIGAGNLAVPALAAALRSSEFWLLYASVFLTGVGVFIPLVHLAPYAQDLGYGEARGVALVSLIGMGSLLGRFSIGPFADRLGRRRSLGAVSAAIGALLGPWLAGALCLRGNAPHAGAFHSTKLRR